MGLKRRLKSTAIIRTDTASCVVFDPGTLLHRLADRCDWWSSPTEELNELNDGHALFLPLQFDGDHKVLVTREMVSDGLRVFLQNVSGEFFIGPGECVTADGQQPKRAEGHWLQCAPGVYEVVAGFHGEQLQIAIVASEELAVNKFDSCPTSLAHDDQSHHTHSLSAGPVLPLHLGAMRPKRNPNQKSSAAGTTRRRTLVGDPFLFRPNDLLHVLGSSVGSSSVRALLLALGKPTEESPGRDAWQGSFASKGIELRVVGDILECIFVYDKCGRHRDKETGFTVHGAFEAYQYELPAGLRFGMSRRELLTKLKGDNQRSALWSSHPFGDGEIVARYRRGVLWAIDLRSKRLG